jgi:hypothetical protein
MKCNILKQPKWVNNLIKHYKEKYEHSLKTVDNLKLLNRELVSVANKYCESYEQDKMWTDIESDLSKELAICGHYEKHKLREILKSYQRKSIIIRIVEEK